MFQHGPSTFVKQAMESLDMRILEIDKLKQHEKVNQTHLEKLKKEIRSGGSLKHAIVVDIDTNIVLDGEHRLIALTQSGCNTIPVVFVDYNSPEIEVQAWREGERLTKKDVIEVGLGQGKLEPTTTRHMIRISRDLVHISAIEKRVDIPLERLQGGAK